MRTHAYQGPLQGVPSLFVHKLDERAKMPVRINDHAIGWDVFAFLLTESGRATSKAIHQKAVTAVPTGIVVHPSEGHYIQVHSRSGLAKKGVFVANAPGIIDPDYSGELIVLLFNGSFETHYVAHEHRIAQLILTPITHCQLEAGEPKTFGRGDNGFGSTGL